MSAERLLLVDDDDNLRSMLDAALNHHGFAVTALASGRDALAALPTVAPDLVVLDVRGLASFTDYFVIMSGRSTRHVQGLAEAIEAELRAKRISSKHSEGLREGLWVLLDFGDVVVHVMLPRVREFYALERLWTVGDQPPGRDREGDAEAQP